MTQLNLQDHPHVRLNPLTGEWVLVSPHRTARPWQGQVEPSSSPEMRPYDLDCYMCPGNKRASGERNPAYTSTFVFENDFASLHERTPEEVVRGGELLVARGEPGICRVVCFSPQHDLTLARMSVADIRIVVDLWIEQSRELGARPDISYVQIFENRGAMMGASNPHPHCQIWASASVPNEVDREHASQRAYHQRHGRDLLGDYLTLEQQAQERLVCANADFVSLVPFWAVWPFEMLVVPVRRIGALDALTGDERGGLADILKQVTARYDKLFDAPFPYSMGFHTQPFDSETHPEWRVHAHFYPPLLRSATIRKFIVGYELLGTPQRDFTPEHAAERLRAALPAIPNAR